MEDKKAAAILMKLLEKYRLDNEEKEAVKSAIGILTWTTLAQSRIKTKKENLKKLTERSIQG